MMSANPMRPADGYVPDESNAPPQRHGAGVHGEEPAQPSQAPPNPRLSPSPPSAAASAAPASANGLASALALPADPDSVSAYPILRHGVVQSVSVGTAARAGCDGGGGSGFTAAASPSHAQAMATAAAAASKAAEAAAAQASPPSLPPLRWSRSAVQLLSCRSGPTTSVGDLSGALEFASMKGATLTAVTNAVAARLQQLPPHAVAATADAAAEDDSDPSQGNTRLFLAEAELEPDVVRVCVCNMNDAMAAAGSGGEAGAGSTAGGAATAADSVSATATAASSSSGPPSSLWQVLECTGEAPRARFGHSATFVPPASIFVYGGFAAAPQFAPATPAATTDANDAPRARALSTQTTFGDAYILDCNTLVWSKIAAPPPQQQPQSQPALSPYAAGAFGQSVAAVKSALKSVTPGRRAFHSCVYFLNERHVDSLASVAATATATATAAQRDSPNLVGTPAAAVPRQHALPHKPANVTTPPAPIPELILFGGCRTIDRAGLATLSGDGGGAGADDEEDESGPLLYLSDLYVLNLITRRWRLINQCFGDRPSARAQHTAVVVTQLSRRVAPSSLSGSPLGLSSRMLVYSGCDASHLLSNCYSLDLWTYTWGRVVTEGEVEPRKQIKGVHTMQQQISASSSSSSLTSDGGGGGGSREWVHRMLQTKREGFVLHLPDPASSAVAPSDPHAHSRHAVSAPPPRAPTPYLLLVGDNETSRTVPPMLNSSARPVKLYMLNTATGFWSTLHVSASVRALPGGGGGATAGLEVDPAAHPAFRNHKPCALLQAPPPPGSPDGTPPRTLLTLITRAALYTLDLTHLQVHHLSRRVLPAAGTASGKSGAAAGAAASSRAEAARMLLHSPILRMQSSLDRSDGAGRRRLGSTSESSASSSPGLMAAHGSGATSPAPGPPIPHTQRAQSHPMLPRGRRDVFTDSPEVDERVAPSAPPPLASAAAAAPEARRERVRTVGEAALRLGAAALKSPHAHSRRHPKHPSMRAPSSLHDEAYNRMSGSSSGGGSASDLDSPVSAPDSDSDPDNDPQARVSFSGREEVAKKKFLRNKNHDTVAEAEVQAEVSGDANHKHNKKKHKSARVSLGVSTSKTTNVHGSKSTAAVAGDAAEEFPPVSSSSSVLSMHLSRAASYAHAYAYGMGGSSGAVSPSPSPGHLHLDQHDRALSLSSSSLSAKSAGSSGTATPTSASARARMGLPRAASSKLGLSSSYNTSPAHSSTPSAVGAGAVGGDTDLFGNAIVSAASSSTMSPASAKLRAFAPVVPASAALAPGAGVGKKLPPPALPSFPPRGGAFADPDMSSSSPGMGGGALGSDASSSSSGSGLTPRMKSSGLRPPAAAASSSSATKLRRTVSESDSGSGSGSGFGPDLFGNHVLLRDSSLSNTPEPMPIPAAIALQAVPSAANRIGVGMPPNHSGIVPDSASASSSSSAFSSGLHSPVARHGIALSQVAEAETEADAAPSPLLPSPADPGSGSGGAAAASDQESQSVLPSFPLGARPPTHTHKRTLHPNQMLWTSLMKQIRDVPLQEQHARQVEQQQRQQQQAQLYKSSHSPQQYKMAIIQKGSPRSRAGAASVTPGTVSPASASWAPSPPAAAPAPNVAGHLPPPASWAGCAGWSQEDVVVFLRGLGPSFEGYLASFRGAAIDGRQLAVLDDEDLRELGVVSRIHRKTMLSAILTAAAPQPQPTTPIAAHTPTPPPQQQQQQQQPSPPSPLSDPSPASASAPAPSLMPSGINIIRASALSNIQRLGAGNFGVTYRAQWREAQAGRLLDVVVKVPRSKSGADEWNELLAFLEVPPHRHVLPLIGICTDFPAHLAPSESDPLLRTVAPPTPTTPGTPVSAGGSGGKKPAHTCCFVTLYMQRGSLKDILSSPSLSAQLLGGDILDPDLHGRDEMDPSAQGRTWARIMAQSMRILLHVAEGLNHLHSYRILHRDVASRNILVNHRGEALLSDFGLSRKIGTGSSSTSSSTDGDGVTDSSGMHHDTGMELSGAAGGYYRLAQPEQTALPLRWMSAESLCEYLFTFASDVWSWAVCAWELLTRAQHVPYSDLHTYNQLMAKVGGGSRTLTLPPYVPPRLARLVSSCWRYDRTTRPTMPEIVAELRTMLAEAEATRIQVERIRRMAETTEDTLVQGQHGDTGADAHLLEEEGGYVRMAATSSPPLGVRVAQQQQQSQQQPPSRQLNSPASSPAVSTSSALVPRPSSAASIAAASSLGSGNTVTFGSVTVASSAPARDGRSAFVESNTTHTMSAGRKGAGVLSKVVAHRHNLAQHGADSDPQGFAPPAASDLAPGASSAAAGPSSGLLQQHVHMRAAAVHAGPQPHQQRVHYSESYDMLSTADAHPNESRFSPLSAARHGVISAEHLEQQQQQFARFQMQAHQQTTRPPSNPAASYPRAALGLPPLDHEDGGDNGVANGGGGGGVDLKDDPGYDPAAVMLASRRAAPESTFRRKVASMQSHVSGLVGALRNSMPNGEAEWQQQQQAPSQQQSSPQQQAQQSARPHPSPPLVRQTSAAQRAAELEWHRQSDQVQLSTPPAAVLEEELQEHREAAHTQTVLLPIAPVAPIPAPLPATQSQAVHALLATAALILPPRSSVPN